ncbi:MAG: carbohydrate binding domain-containing protein [Acidobacteria bacterium]|nr:carbohydrate binding domain-containing protein [Acidobacteriota bacterium]
MRQFKILALLFLVVLFHPPFASQAQTHTLMIQVGKPRAQVAPNQFGIFFEDINFGADGGIYAELVKNRSFEFPDGLMGWRKLGEAKVLERENRQANNRHYLQLAGGGIANSGFRGIGVRQGEEYLFSLQARNSNSTPASLRIELVNASGKVLAQTRLRGIAGDWKTYHANLRPTATETKAQLNLIPESGGAIDLDVVSLFPKDTWKGRTNGLRADLVQLLRDLHPGFIRFPGGCIVEGRNLNERYQWKTTIGDPAERKLIINRWNLEFRTRNPERAPDDYFQSFGLGFFEYFQLCEEVGANPLPILNCGMACQFNSGELVPLNQLDPYIQDALDLIEFANGSVATTWGRKRAELGHSAPFNLKMIGVGNEQWGPDYVPRYEAFAKAIKAKYPKITLVSSAGPFPDGDRFTFLWDKLRGLNADLIDEHYYRPPKWFLDNANRYNDYSRTGTKVFAGEYAAHVSVQGRPDRPNNWEAALSEAAFLTGLDRNADVVSMASYAPLFAHVDAWQWSPNLIWFDNLRSFGTPSYYVQQLFSRNSGTDILPITIDGSALNGQQQIYASALGNVKTREVILKLVNASPSSMQVKVNLDGIGQISKSAQSFVLASDDLKTENNLDAPKRLAPVEAKVSIKAANFDYTLPGQSLTVLRIAYAKSVQYGER